MTSVVEFLSTRLGEVEAAALQAGGHDWTLLTFPAFTAPEERGEIELAGGQIMTVPTPDLADHISRHDPARVLAQVAAMRRMLDLRYSWALQIDKAPAEFRHVFEAQVSAADAIIRGYAAIWSSHPDYDSAWAPS